MGSAFTPDDIDNGPIVLKDSIDFGFRIKLPDGGEGLALVSRVAAAHPAFRGRLVARLNFRYRQGGQEFLDDLKTGRKVL